jgi:hypothetical protein
VRLDNGLGPPNAFSGTERGLAGARTGILVKSWQYPTVEVLEDLRVTPAVNNGIFLAALDIPVGGKDVGVVDLCLRC